jgi:hypothetical protein
MLTRYATADQWAVESAWLDFLTPEEKRYVSQVQGRTYANMFDLVERFINAKV